MDAMQYLICINVFVLFMFCLLMGVRNSMYECDVININRIGKIATIIYPDGGCLTTSHCLKRCVVKHPPLFILYLNNYYGIKGVYRNMSHCLKRCMTKYTLAIRKLEIFKMQQLISRNTKIRMGTSCSAENRAGGSMVYSGTFKNINFLNKHYD